MRASEEPDRAENGARRGEKKGKRKMKSRKLTLAAALKSRMGASKQVKHREHWFASGAGRTPELDWGRSMSTFFPPP